MMTDGNRKDVRITSESYNGSEINCAERKPRSRERGPDKKPRTYSTNSMNNFVQFKDRPEEFAKYLKDVKGVDIDRNSNLVKILLIFVGISLAGVGSWWLYNHYKNRRNDNIENR